MDLQAIIDAIAARMSAETDLGEVASYIPELASVDPNQFGIAVALADGQVLRAGDAEVPFSIQSVSKVFMLAIALGRIGDGLWLRVGREPSGQAFNSILQLELEQGRPRNPFINAGAIVVTDAVLQGRAPREVLAELLTFIRSAASDGDIHINDAVARSEAATGFLNMSLANYMRAHGNMRNPTELSLGVYFHQCAIEMSCVQLAQAGRFLAGLPVGPHMVSNARVRRINALMMMCGHYDASGEFAYRVGLPGKSGVGGGILAVAPGRASIAVWSPGLNGRGSSTRGALAMEQLARHTGWSVFGPG